MNSQLVDVSRGAYRPAAGIAVLLLVVWLASGGGYFWPMWAWFGLTLPLALLWTVRRVRTGPGAATRRRGTTAVACMAVIACADVLIWLMSGAGYFWPIWTVISVVVVTVLWRFWSHPRERELASRVDELTRTRAGAVDVQASELRRIERDLHDGAQARLVALSMQIGRAEERLAQKGADSGDLELLRNARHEATAAITELRDLARGISPPVLADRGLGAAVESLARRTGSDVEVHAELDHRPPPAVENAAYFVVAEALTNASKHTPGAPVQINIWHEREQLGIVVTDHGSGGADATGNGLGGLSKRVEALDGWLEVTSTVGEGTTIRAMIPCR